MNISSGSNDSGDVDALLNVDDLQNSTFERQMRDYTIGIHSRQNRKAPLAVIYTCSFGGGHKSASAAVEQYLRADGFDVKTIDTTRDPEFVSFGSRMGDKFFNEFILGKQMYTTFNLIDKGGRALGGVSV